jgi:hypothetical protein
MNLLVMARRWMPRTMVRAVSVSVLTSEACTCVAGGHASGMQVSRRAQPCTHCSGAALAAHTPCPSSARAPPAAAASCRSRSRRCPPSRVARRAPAPASQCLCNATHSAWTSKGHWWQLRARTSAGGGRTTTNVVAKGCSGPHAHLVADSVVRIILSRASVSALCIKTGVRQPTRRNNRTRLRHALTQPAQRFHCPQTTTGKWVRPLGVMRGGCLHHCSRLRGATHLSWASAAGQQLPPSDLIVGASELLARLRHPDFKLQRRSSRRETLLSNHGPKAARTMCTRMRSSAQSHSRRSGKG